MLDLKISQWKPDMTSWVKGVAFKGLNASQRGLTI